MGSRSRSRRAARRASAGRAGDRPQPVVKEQPDHSEIDPMMCRHNPVHSGGVHAFSMNAVASLMLGGPALCSRCLKVVT